jgi:hypothetical protein
VGSDNDYAYEELKTLSGLIRNLQTDIKALSYELASMKADTSGKFNTISEKIDVISPNPDITDMSIPGRKAKTIDLERINGMDLPTLRQKRNYYTSRIGTLEQIRNKTQRQINELNDKKNAIKEIRKRIKEIVRDNNNNSKTESGDEE